MWPLTRHRDRRRFFGAGFWTPAQLGSSLALWLDASDASTITLNGSTVSQWSDKSGNAKNFVQTSSSAQPTYTPSGMNGKNTLSFSGTQYFNDISLPNSANNITVYLMSKPLAVGLYHNFFERVSAEFPMVWVRPSNEWEMNATGLNVGGSLIGTAHIAGFGIKTTSPKLSFWGNGATALTADTNSVPWPDPSTFSFSNRGGVAGFIGDMSEIVWVDGPITESERQKLEGYLAWKWGGL